MSKKLKILGLCVLVALGLFIFGADYWSQNKLEIMARLGFNEAQYELGMRHFYQASPEALDWFMKAANDKHTPSMNKLGEIYRDVGNYDEAIKWYGKSAMRNDPTGQNELGLVYLDHLNKPDEALRWFKLSAEQGHIEGQLDLGIVYAFIYHNQEEGIKWLKLVASRERYPRRGTTSFALSLNEPIDKAQYCLGIIYANMGNMDEAVRWLKEAAQNEYEPAQRELNKRRISY